MTENEGFLMSSFSLDRTADSNLGSISSASSSKMGVLAPLINMRGNNRVKHKCEEQQKIAESVEKNLCRRVRLGQACRDGQKDIVSRLLKGSLSTINDIDEDGMAAIHYAARCNHVEILRMLIRAGADIEVKGSEKVHSMTPLICAAKFNAIDACRILIQEGADVNVKNCYSQTALYDAVRRLNRKIVELLLTEGKMDVNVVDIDKTTPLHMAAQVGDELSAKLLLFHGIDIKAQDNDGFTAFHLAAREGKNEVLKTLLSKAQDRKMDTRALLDMPDNYGNTCLHLAVKHGRCQATCTCLTFGASSCVWESSLQTPLHLAAVSGNLCVLKTLFAGKDKDIHTEDGDGMTAILRASIEGNLSVVEYLLEQGAHLNAPPGTGFPSPLMCAVKRDRHETIKFLLSKGAIIDQIDSQWRNCLHIAGACSDPKTMKILLDNGGKHLVDKKDSYGKTPLHYAALRCAHVCKIVQLLTAAGGRAMSCDNAEQIPLHYSARCGIVASALSLIEVAPESVNQGDARSMTPLHIAAAAGHQDVCRVLLNHKAEVDYRDDFRLTPLFHAVTEGCPMTIKVLVEFGADIDALDKARRTPLLVAAFRGKISAFKTLLECGADISNVCSTGMTVLDAALESDQLNICTEIIRHKRWRDVMANLKYDKVTPMKRLIEKFPCIAKTVMDKCIKETTNVDTDQNYAIEYDFQYLCPKPGEDIDSDGKRFFGPKAMLAFEREDLLRHPLTKSLMATKWTSVGIKFFYLGFMIYAMFVGCFSHYMFCMHKLEMYNKSMEKEYTASKITTHCGHAPIYITEIVLVLFSSLNLIYELYQLHTERSKYFELTNILQVSTFVCAIITVYPMNGDSTITATGWNAGVIGVMLSFLTILQYIQCLLYAGIYVTMLFEVLKSLLKVFALFSLLIVGFGIVFILVMDKSIPFNHFDTGIIKVYAMTLGEIEYSRYFVDEKPKRFVLALIVFVVFSLMMPIALMNLLIGLAVGDIESVQSHAELKMMTTEIETVFEFEQKMPMVFRNRMHKSKLVVHPNKQPRWKKYLQRISNMNEIMALRMKDESFDRDNARDNVLNSLQSQVETHGERINIILTELQAQRGLLEGIAATMHTGTDNTNDQHDEQQHNLIETDNILGRL